MVDNAWHYIKDGKTNGPVPRAHIVSLILAGTLPPDALVWSKGMTGWQPAREALDLSSELPPALPGAVSQAPALPTADAPFHPWRRYLARMVDTALNGTLTLLTLFIIVIPFINEGIMDSVARVFEAPGGAVLDTMLTFFGAIFLNAAMIGFTGSSVGKYLFGVKVLGPNGLPMGYALALKREFSLWYRGLAFGLPLITFLTLINAYSRLEKKRDTYWDEALGTKLAYAPTDATLRLKCALGFAALIAFAVLSRA